MESASDLDSLGQLGFDLAQGYFICPPGPAEEITKWPRDQGVRPFPVPRDSELPPLYPTVDEPVRLPAAREPERRPMIEAKDRSRRTTD